MAVLKQAGLVESRKQGRWIYFRLPNEQAVPGTKQILALVSELLKNDETALCDKKALRKIVCHDTEDLCKTQRKK
jgi:DNA-binding transcriptional ArsR family regulator